MCQPTQPTKPQPARTPSKRICSLPNNSNIVTDGFYVARTGLGPFGEGWEEKGEDVDWFLYNRLWGVGVFTLIEDIGLEPTEEVNAQVCGYSL